MKNFALRVIHLSNIRIKNNKNKFIFLFTIFLLSALTNISFGQEGWTNISSPLGRVITYCASDDGKIILLATSKGIWRCSNFDGKWEFLSSPGKKINRLAYADNMIIAGTEEGVYRSPDIGMTWIKTGVPDSNFQFLIYTSQHYLYTLAFPGILYSSSDRGISWNKITYIPEQVNKPIWTKTYDDEEGDIYLCVDSVSYVKSEDNGNTWNLVKLPLMGRSINPELIFNGKEIIFVSSPGNCYSSFDEGKNWEQVKSPEGDIWLLRATHDNKLRFPAKMHILNLNPEITVKPGSLYNGV